MKMKYRIVSLLLCGLLLFVSFSGLVLAGDVQTGTCTHAHTEECYTKVTACLYAADSTTDTEDEASAQQEEHVCSEESGCVTRVLLCSHVHDAQCGYFEAPKPQSVLSWKWIDEEGYLVQDEETGVWGLGLPGTSKENPVTEQVLVELLPAQVDAVPWRCRWNGITRRFQKREHTREAVRLPHPLERTMF